MMNQKTRLQSVASAFTILCLSALCTAQSLGQDSQGIEVYTKNPFYWQFKGTPILLLGASSNDNLFQTPDVADEISLLHSIGGNYLRCTMSSRDERDIWPYKTVEDGKYDLRESNPQYWERFKHFLSLTASKHIVVQVELWATYDFYGDYWDKNPYNPTNNVNYDVDVSRLPEAHRHKGWEKVNPFFHSVPALDNNGLLLEIQQHFVDKLIDISYPYHHVVYSIDNETNASPEWGKYWATYLKDKAESIGKNGLYVTEMWDNWDPTGGNVPGIGKTQFDGTHTYLERSTPLNTIEHPEIYDFIDISNHNGQLGQVHYETGLWVRNHVAEMDMVRPINNVKIYGAGEKGWNGSAKDGLERFWRNIFAGHAAVRFHRPAGGIGISQQSLNQIKGATMILEKVDFFTLEPSNSLLANRDDNEAYCLANSKNEYLLYFPAHGEITLNASQGRYEKQILHLETATWGSSKSVELPGLITTDIDEPCVIVLTKEYGPKVKVAERNKETLPIDYTKHAESHNLKRFSRVVEGAAVFLLDEEGNRMFRCLSNEKFAPKNVTIDPQRGLILQATVTGDGKPGTDVPSEHTHSGGVMSGKHFGGEFSFWSFSPDPPTHRVRVDIYATIPRPLGAKLAVWSFADDWYPGGGSVISLEMDMIEAGGRPKEWVDGSRDGLFRYHPNLHCWFGGGSPWGHKSVFHTEPKELDFGPEEKEHKLSWEWYNGQSNDKKILRYLIDDRVVYERCVADLKEKHPKLDRGGMKGVECTMSAKEIAEYMWDKPQNLQLWYGADRDFFLSDTPQYGDDWPSEMVIRRIDVYR